jgi:predicted MPP superfamily phosphohydrolase
MGDMGIPDMAPALAKTHETGGERPRGEPAVPSSAAGLRSPASLPRLSRRRFLKLGVCAGAGTLAAGGYSFIEPHWLRLTRVDVAVPRLPLAFAGQTVALLADIHHGPFTSLEHVRAAVDLTLQQSPDLVALCGDYVYHGSGYARPCARELGRLRAPLGVFFVLGNHDCAENPAAVREALKEQGLTDLTNAGVWLPPGGLAAATGTAQRLRVAGVGDLWTEEQDLTAGLGDARPEDACLLLSHNPCFAEEIRDARVSLVFSGHTHGGQVQFPFLGPVVLPRGCPRKYAQGLVRAPRTQVYISRGIGVVGPPVRFCCRPEVCLLTLRPERAAE